MLEKENQLLREEIARLKKNSEDSSKPPSSDQNKPVRVAVRSKVNRKQGGQPGHKKHSRQPFAPEEIDKVVKHELKGKGAAGLEPLGMTGMLFSRLHCPKSFILLPNTVPESIVTR